MKPRLWQCIQSMKNSSKQNKFSRNRNNKLGKSEIESVFFCILHYSQFSVHCAALTLHFNYKDFSRSNQSILFKFFPLNIKKNKNQSEVSLVAEFLLNGITEIVNSMKSQIFVNKKRIFPENLKQVPQLLQLLVRLKIVKVQKYRKTTLLSGKF